MAAKKAKTARRVALDVLSRFDVKRHDAGQLLDKLIEQTSEKQQASDLVFGTIRNRSAIDIVITKVADVPRERIPKIALNILRIAGYELIYSPATAEYAIVNEAVNQAKEIVGRRQSGFVNAVLRKICRSIVNRNTPLSQSDLQKTLPCGLRFGCEFNLDLLPNPDAEPVSYLSGAFSLPAWLIKTWQVEFGLQQTQSICFASNRRPRLYVRVNTLKTTTEALAESFRLEGINFEVLPEQSMIRVTAGGAVSALPGFADGMFSIQDPTACRAVKLLKPQSGQVIADMCAAPGGKTTQLAQLMGNKGRIIATDIDAKRLEKVAENCKRLGITIVTTVPYDKFARAVSQSDCCDAILLDVPCSNTGVLARRCEVRLRISSKMVSDLSKIQAELLQSAGAMLKSKTRLCYSTCSIQRQENSEQVEEFLSKSKDFELELEDLTLPSSDNFDCDGGYAAILRKK